ncbi:D-glycero-alpha-D-manno-heptose-1,7-bisphosphate 7-phosphatase, partial [Myxococcota bacterium]
MPLPHTSDGQPAVFLDRDGTLIEDRGPLGAPEQVVFFPDTVAALRQLNGRFALFIITHQPAVAQGELTLSQVTAVNQHVTRTLAQAGIALAGVSVCPHLRSQNCECIKPKPLLVHEAAHQHRVDLSRSYTVGDHPHDVELAKNVGATGVYVLTGHGLKH